MLKYAFVIQYDGNGFAGYQRQIGQTTVQECIEDALLVIFKRRIKIYAAGRTDTGVSATAQVIHFRLPDEAIAKIKNLEVLMYSLNALLPKQISFVYGSQVDEKFHARFSCLSREYVYRIYNQPFRYALLHQKAFWVRKPLDLTLMRKAALALLGEHDFAAFTRAIYFKNQEKTIRRIDAIEILEKPPYIDIVVAGSGFLHNMIRILCGTLLEVGKKKLSIERVEEILHSRDRTLSSTTLPAFALTFRRAIYNDFIIPENIYLSM